MERSQRTGRGQALLRRGAGLLALAVLAGAVFTTGCGGDDDDAKAVTGLDERGYSDTSRLVTTQWIEDHLDDDSVLVIDLRNEELYAAGHIPGAVRLAASGSFQKEIGGVPGLIPPAAEVAGVLAGIGATPEMTIVFYDQRGSIWASRGLWVLSVYGHDDVRLLDGDFPLWESEGRGVSTATPTVAGADYAFTSSPNNGLIAGWDELVSAIDDPSVLVCDARSPEEYAGRDVRADRGGHIPESLNVEWSRAIGEDGRFLPADELRELYDGEGVVAGNTVYTLCQTAVRATHTWFVLTDLLGYPDVRVYDGSWVEYGNREDSPIES